ncbi:four helix bundle protein [archaeon]|nr:MAG: four helix bundle protein [archaeon]
MATVERFEDLEVWQKARDVVNAVYQASSVGTFSRDYALRDQIGRAVVSIPSNIAEGFSRHSNKEFIQFLFISKGSVAEVQSQLYTALDQDYISQEAFDSTYERLEVVARQLSRFVTYLKGSG